MMSKRDLALSRRRFLRLAGGGAMALPLLGEANAAPDPTARRLIVIFSPVGTVPFAWVPKAGFQLGEIMAPKTPMAPYIGAGLVPHAKDLIVVDNLTTTAVLESNVGGCGHMGLPSLLTGRRVVGYVRTSAHSAVGTPEGPSVDQVIAERFQATHRL